MLLSWNTLQEAADYLTEQTGQKWTERAVLDVTLKTYQAFPENPPSTCLKAAPPKNTQFALYKWDDEIGTPANPFVFQHYLPWQKIPLFPVHVAELLGCGETDANIARRPEDRNGEAGRYVFVEPKEQPFPITLSMVVISGDDLQLLAFHAVGQNRDKIIELAANDGKNIDWAHWLGLPFWKPEEAVSLLMLYEPGTSPRNPDIRAELDKKIQAALREQACGKLPEHVAPAAWIEWAKGKGWIIPSQLEGLAAKQPEPEGGKAETLSEARGPLPKIKTNRTNNEKTNILSAVIERAEKDAENPNDNQSIWAAFVNLAKLEDETRPAPLLGFVYENGVKYMDANGASFISKRNFLRRLNRKKEPTKTR